MGNCTRGRVIAAKRGGGYESGKENQHRFNFERKYDAGNFVIGNSRGDQQFPADYVQSDRYLLAGPDRNRSAGSNQFGYTGTEYYHKFRNGNHGGRFRVDCTIYRRKRDRECQKHGESNLCLCRMLRSFLCSSCICIHRGDRKLAGSRGRDISPRLYLSSDCGVGYALSLYGEYFFGSASGPGRYGAPHVSESGRTLF